MLPLASLEARPFALTFPPRLYLLGGLEGRVGTVGVQCRYAGLLPQDIRNTVGNVPLEWYDDFPHVGYDLDGRRIYKPLRTPDELDQFLDKMDNPDYWCGRGAETVGWDRAGGLGRRGLGQGLGADGQPLGVRCGTG